MRAYGRTWTGERVSSSLALLSRRSRIRTQNDDLETLVAMPERGLFWPEAKMHLTTLPPKIRLIGKEEIGDIRASALAEPSRTLFPT